MNIKVPIVVKVKLRAGVNIIPKEGLTVPKLRVELAEEKEHTSAWIAELKVLGDLPWRKGEERIVELRIMSDKFRDYVVMNKPSLLVKYGSEILGDLEFRK